MSTDRELLELAAKAFWGEEIDDVCSVRWLEEDQAIGYTHGDNQDHNGLDQEFVWNPLADGGDALRLLAAMPSLWILSLKFGGPTVEINVAWGAGGERTDKIAREFAGDGADVAAAIRRAIVRAAAEIGRAMP